MISNHRHFLFALALATACGNYSNEDIDFQLSLPEQSDVEAKLPQALLILDSAEYYVKTRKAVTDFNGLIIKTIALIDYVRSNPPTTRKNNHRVWGPFPSDTHPNWLVQVVMDKEDLPSDPTLLKISYSLKVSPKGSDLFTDLLTGNFQKSSNSNRGLGHMQWFINNARDKGYPVDADGMVDLLDVTVDYNNATFPRTVHLSTVNQENSDTRGATYDYSEAQDGSGNMTFDWQLATPNLSAKIVSRWQGAGAGRADLMVTLANVTWIRDTDCWGPDTRATYIFRKELIPQEPLIGALKTACLFPDPL